MQKILKRIFSAPSIRFNTLVVLEVVILLTVSLGVLFFFTRKAFVEEAKKDAMLRLEGTSQKIDNVLLSIEQGAGNFYYELLEHLDAPDRMQTYCRRLVECNPNIMGCAIAFKPGYYPEREMFFTYVSRKKYNSPELLFTDKSINIPYTKQDWFTETMKTCRPSWIDPGQNKDYNVEPIITFCLPITDSSKECIGVIAVGLSVNLLSQIVMEDKPTPHSYNVMFGHNGSYIIHPDRKKLAGQTVFSHPEITNNPSALSAAKDVRKGDVGEISFEMKNETWYAFYKPFVRNNIPGRSTEALNWHIAAVYPKTDIFGEYNHLIHHVLGIVFAGLLVFYVLVRKSIRSQLKPLKNLTESAESIAEGHYDEYIPDTKRSDEIGIFQQHFQQMQQALAADIQKQEEQRTILNEHREQLQKTHHQIQEDELIKSTFLHNITNKMLAPSESLLNSVNTLCDNYMNITLAEANYESENISRQSETILELLKHKFKASPNKTGKEVSHE